MPKIARIPDDLDPAARFVLKEIKRTYGGSSAWWRVEAGAGLGADSIRSWLYQKRVKRGPPIGAVRAALNELGYDLAIVKRDGKAMTEVDRAP